MSGAAAVYPGRPQAARRTAAADPSAIRGVETFAVGNYPGDKAGETWRYTDDDLQTIARNFALLSAGANPIHRVPVVQTHDQVTAHGWAYDVAKVGDLLTTDWERVSPDLRAKIRAGRLAKVSAEIKRDFADKDGRIIAKGPYLYRVAVLGADVPRVKGLRDVEAYADRAFKFSDTGVGAMTRAEAIQLLTGFGVDPASLGDAVPDATLIGIAEKWYADARLKLPPAPTPPSPTPTPPAPTVIPPVPIAQPVQVFADPATLRQFVAATVAEVVGRETAKLTAAVAAENAARDKRAAEERAAGVRLFCDRQAEANRISPADNDEGSPLSIRSRLLRLAAQPPAVHKFTDPATKRETTQTELELQQAEIERLPVRRFAERVKADGKGGTQTPADPFAQKVAERFKALNDRHDAITAGNRAARN